MMISLTWTMPWRFVNKLCKSMEGVLWFQGTVIHFTPVPSIICFDFPLTLLKQHCTDTTTIIIITTIDPSDAKNGGGTGSILLDNVRCDGNENRLTQCGNNGWGIHNCDHSEDVSVECQVERKLMMN